MREGYVRVPSGMCFHCVILSPRLLFEVVAISDVAHFVLSYCFFSDVCVTVDLSQLVSGAQQMTEYI